MEKHEQHEHKKEHEHVEKSATSTKPMDTKTIVMMVMVGLLVLVSAVQAVQLMDLKEKLSDDSLTVSSASGKTAVGAGPGAGGSSLSKNLENLPSMVGGC